MKGKHLRPRVTRCEYDYIMAVWSLYDKIIEEGKQRQRELAEMTGGDPNTRVVSSV